MNDEDLKQKMMDLANGTERPKLRVLRGGAGKRDQASPYGMPRPAPYNVPSIASRNHPSMGKAFKPRGTTPPSMAPTFEPFESTTDSDPTPPHGMSRPSKAEQAGFKLIKGEK
jgi:hypothetical protein